MASRGATGPAPRNPEAVGLPFRAFMYTVDQISLMTEIEEKRIREDILHYEGRSPGARPNDKLKSINIALREDKPDWRVSEQELIRWMRVKGIRYYERGWGQ